VLRKLPIHLTDDERNTKARHAASLLHERALLEERKRETVADFADRIKELTTEINAASTAARTGIEEREVEVSPKPNNERLLVEFYRDDTGDLVETRPMTEDEIRVARQQVMPFRDVNKVVAFDASLRTGTSPVSPLRGNTKPPINPQG
jgi:hypothetical protein